MRRPDLAGPASGSWDSHDLSQTHAHGPDLSAFGTRPLFFGRVEQLGYSDPHTGRKGLGIFPESLIYNGDRITFLEAFADFQSRSAGRSMSALYLEPGTVVLIRDGLFQPSEPGGGLAIIRAEPGEQTLKVAQVMPGETFPVLGIPLLPPWG
jgi:hypothetical protein